MVTHRSTPTADLSDTLPLVPIAPGSGHLPCCVRPRTSVWSGAGRGREKQALDSVVSVEAKAWNLA